MQAVILAAGRGTRMDELTSATPKAMLEVSGKPLIEYKFDAMPESIDEIVVIVGYLAEVIKRRYGGEYRDKKLTYLTQEHLDGTAGALWLAKDILRERFLVLNGDDIFTAEDLARCAQESPSWKLLVQQSAEMHRAGSVEIDENANITAIVEGDLGERPGLASTNSFLLDERLFAEPLVPKQAGSNEYGLPQTVMAAATTLGIQLEPIFTSEWIQINYPADLIQAEKILKTRAAK